MQKESDIMQNREEAAQKVDRFGMPLNRKGRPKIFHLLPLNDEK